jgi:hypothetical protein
MFSTEQEDLQQVFKRLFKVITIYEDHLATFRDASLVDMNTSYQESCSNTQQSILAHQSLGKAFSVFDAFAVQPLNEGLDITKGMISVKSQSDVNVESCVPELNVKK